MFGTGVIVSYECRVAYIRQLRLSGTCTQEIINMNKNRNLANFFSYVCNGKKIKKLFASTLNGIIASARCVSFIIVVLNAELT